MRLSCLCANSRRAADKGSCARNSALWRLAGSIRSLRLGIPLLLLLLVALGCGTSTAPTGLTLIGTVVDALNPTVPIAGAYVYIPHIPPPTLQAGPPEPAITFDITDSNGRFVLENVPAGDFTLKVAPPEAGGYAAPLAMEFRGITQAAVLPQIRITLLDQAAQDQLNQSGNVRVIPDSATLQTGDTEQFSLEITGANLAATATPTWIAWGNVGTIDENGLFTATAEGQGLVLAYLGRFVVSATVTVGSGGQITVELSATPESGDVPLTVNFTGTAQPVDAQHPIEEYRLSFGDGSDPAVSATAPTDVAHIYQQSGFYTAVLEARDATGRVGYAEKVIPATVAGRIAFATARDGNFEIYVMNSDGTGATRLTNNSATDALPAWSPDGTKIAFMSNRDGNQEIYVMNSDGTGQTRLTNDPAVDSYPAWSPDGAKIAFTSDRDANQEIYVMNPDGTGQTNLTNNAAGDWLPAWSPDGTELAFASDRDGNQEIYLMSSDGTGQVNKTNDSAGDWMPAWSPDGRKIAFVTDRDGDQEIYIMNSDGSAQENLTNDPAGDNTPSWSPDGMRIAFVSDRDGNSEIYIKYVNDGLLINLTNNPATDSGPAWSPVP